MGRRCAMKATDLLKRQHREVKGLFKKIEDTENSSERRKLMTTIAQELKVHTTIEEEIFYPAMREVQSKKAEEMVNEAYEDTTWWTSCSGSCPRSIPRTSVSRRR